MTQSHPRRPRRWLRRILLALAVAFLLLAVSPFLLTTSLARWFLQRSAYANFSPTLESAALRINGTLTLHGLALHEPKPHNNDPLLTANSVTIAFSWRSILSKKVHTIDARDVTLFLRPGATDTHAPISAIDLAASPATPPAATAPAPLAAPVSSSASAPFWYDTLHCEGHIDFTALTQVRSAATTSPFDLTSSMHGNRASPSRSLILSIGNSSTPTILAQAVMEPLSDGTRITLNHFSAHDLQATFQQSFLESILKTAPDTFHQNLDAHLDSLDASATLDHLSTGLTGKAHLDMHGLSISAPPSAKHPFELKNVALTLNTQGPLNTHFTDTGTLTDSQLSFDAITYGKNGFEHFSTPLSIAGGTLQAPSIKLTFAKGDFSGTLRYSLANKKLEVADLQVQHLDQKQLAANLAPDKLDAEGTTSGTIHLASVPDGTLTGTINLIADGPGRLQIKDQQAAESLAQKLQTGAAAGVLPANFSTIVVQQLKDYPYKTGHIQVDAPEGIPNITLNYARDPIKAGDPGYGIETTIAGQKVLANYTIQLPALTIVLQGKTIAGVLALATGFEHQLASVPPHK